MQIWQTGATGQLCCCCTLLELAHPHLTGPWNLTESVTETLRNENTNGLLIIV